MSGVFSGDGLQ
jgi:hypothetical protein